MKNKSIKATGIALAYAVASLMALNVHAAERLESPSRARSAISGEQCTVFVEIARQEANAVCQAKMNFLVQQYEDRLDQICEKTAGDVGSATVDAVREIAGCQGQLKAP
jgi:hypothetical protein